MSTKIQKIKFLGIEKNKKNGNIVYIFAFAEKGKYSRYATFTLHNKWHGSLRKETLKSIFEKAQLQMYGKILTEGDIVTAVVNSDKGDIYISALTNEDKTKNLKWSVVLKNYAQNKSLICSWEEVTNEPNFLMESHSRLKSTFVKGEPDSSHAAKILLQGLERQKHIESNNAKVFERICETPIQKEEKPSTYNNFLDIIFNSNNSANCSPKTKDTTSASDPDDDMELPF